MSKKYYTKGVAWNKSRDSFQILDIGQHLATTQHTPAMQHLYIMTAGFAVASTTNIIISNIKF